MPGKPAHGPDAGRHSHHTDRQCGNRANRQQGQRRQTRHRSVSTTPADHSRPPRMRVKPRSASPTAPTAATARKADMNSAAQIWIVCP